VIDSPLFEGEVDEPEPGDYMPCGNRKCERREICEACEARIEHIGRAIDQGIDRRVALAYWDLI